MEFGLINISNIGKFRVPRTVRKMYDMAHKEHIDQDAPSAIWPNLLLMYHKNKEPKSLHMVGGAGTSGVP